MVLVVIIIIKVVIVVADGLLRVTTITEVTARSTRRGRIIFVSNSNNRISKEYRCRRDSRRRITIDGTAAHLLLSNTEAITAIKSFRERRRNSISVNPL